MSLKKKINAVRRNVLRSITKNIGHTNFCSKNSKEVITFNRVLISRPNGRLGNMLLITPLVQEITELFPDCKIDLFVKGGLANVIFENYNNINRIIQLPKKPFKDLFQYFRPWVLIKRHRYDVVINVINRSSSGRLSATLVDADYKFFGEPDTIDVLCYDDYENFAKKPVYHLRSYLLKMGVPVNNKPVAKLDIKLTADEVTKGLSVLNRLANPSKKTICLFTYATGNKMYKTEWWDDFYNRLESEYGSQYNFVEVLPVENVSQLGFKITTYYSKDIREIASVIANAVLFIGADSGMMHLASSAQTATVGLFKVTKPEIYQPYGNSSTGINTNITDADGCIAIVDQVLKKAIQAT